MNLQTITVWDPLIRIFHWSLLIAYTVAYFTQEQDYNRHLQSGYFILALIAVRLSWGVIGTQYARFTNFIYRPSTIYQYIKALINKQPPAYKGHNPAGGFMVMLLLICLLILCISGVALDAAENRSGPFANTHLFLYQDIIVGVHSVFTYISLTLIVLHITGVLFSSFIHKENLVRAMITGKKNIAESQQE